MDSLTELIKLLNQPAKKHFRQFLGGKNKREDVKNLQLFDLLETDDIDNIKKLYNTKKNKDAYHALRKRLQDSLLYFLSKKTFETKHSESYEALRLLVVGRFLLENDLVKIAFKCLDKAERLAEQLEQYNLLNEVLLLKLQYAHLAGAEELAGLSIRFMQNQAEMQREAKLSMAYAALRQELKAIHLQGKILSLSALVLSTIRKYKISLQDLMTYKALYQILFIANEYAAIQQNYGLIERLINRTNLFLQNSENRKHSYLYYHISIIYFLANYHLRARNFDKSASYLDDMKGLMSKDARYEALFQPRHQLLTSLNLFFTGLTDKAVLLLQETLSNKKQRSKTEEIDDLRITLTMFLALRNDRGSVKQLSLLSSSDAWYEKKMGMLWTIRKNLMEILIHEQFSNIELALSRLSSFKRRYKKYLMNTSEERVLIFLKLVEQYLIKPDVLSDPPFRNNVTALLKSTENNDIFNLSFIAWLIAKWEKKTSYEVVLHLINNQHTRNSALLTGSKRRQKQQS